MERLGVGFALHPDFEYLELSRGIIEDEADYLEVNPETLWRVQDGGLVRNDYHPLFREMRERSRKPFVAHGLNFSVGTPVDEDGEPARIRDWMDRLRDDMAVFQFPWISEHLGWTTAGGLQGVLPLPLPFTEEAVQAVAARMRLLASVCPTVAFENNVTYFAMGGAAREPDFFNAICGAAPCEILLDLHNAHTQCLNFGLDPFEYVDAIDADTVLQIHLSGGSESEPDWVPSKRTFRLDSHDGPVPELVWTLLERLLPRCRNLRGIVVERLNGTFQAAEVPALRDEVRRARGLFRC